MFDACSSLKLLDLSGFDTRNVTDMSWIFRNCSNLSSLSLGKNFSDITEERELPNEGGWANKNAPETLISGSKEHAVFKNKGTGGTYIRMVEPTRTDVVYGDANLDGDVSLADALLILQHVANGQKYEMSEQAELNADVYNRGDGLTAMDALTIQKYDAKLVTTLPESYQK